MTWFAWIFCSGHKAFCILSKFLLIFLLYGIFQAIRGLKLNHEIILVLQNVVFNIYPFYLFLGLLVGITRPELLKRLIRFLAVINAVYGTLYIFFLNRINIYLPWAPNIPVFGQPGAAAIVLLGLLSLEPHLNRNWLILLINFFILLGVQIRGEWLTFSIGLLIWIILSKNFSRLALLGAIFIIIFFIFFTFDIQFMAPQTRGGEISVRGIIARVLAPFNPESAAKLIGEEAYSFAGTITNWRMNWWLNIWDEVHRDGSSAFFGFGYGYPIYNLLSYVSEGLRTPHSVFFYALGYTGWLGVFIFFSFQFSLAYALYKSYLISNNIFGISLWAGIFCSSLFGNFFETPFGAIPFYLLIGYCLSPIYLSLKDL